MKMFLISDNVDTKTGMRLAGIDGVVVHDLEEVRGALKKVLNDSEVGIVIITEKLVELAEAEISDIKIKYQTPLIVEIPDRHGTRRAVDSITRYVRDAVGLKI